MHACTSKDKSTGSQISGLGGPGGCERLGSDGCTSNCSRVVAAEFCLSRCQECARAESRGQRQRQGSVSHAAGEIHFPHMCTFIFLLLVTTHWCIRDVRQLVLPLFLWVPCVLFVWPSVYKCILYMAYSTLPVWNMCSPGSWEDQAGLG